MPRLALLAALMAAVAAVAAPVPKALRKKQTATLNGTWESVEWYSNGNKVNSTTTFRWTIDGENLAIERFNKGPGAVAARVGSVTYTLTRPDGGAANALDYTIHYNNGANPPTRLLPAVFELDGDALKFCMATAQNGERPAECGPVQGTTFYVFKRVESK